MVAPHRSVSMNALYNNALTVWPGMEIGWIGDLSHQGEVSGHNPDDYAPLQAEQVDADNDPEVRALDFMIGSKFTVTDAQSLTNALVTGVDKNRLYYVIYNRLIYKRSNNYQPTQYTGTDPHTNHVHASGRAVDDANGSNWTSVLALGDYVSSDDVIAGMSELMRMAAHREGSTGRNFANWSYAVMRSADGFPVPNPDSPEGAQLQPTLNSMDDKLDEIIANGGDGSGVPFTLDDIRHVIREELNNTKLSG